MTTYPITPYVVECEGEWYAVDKFGASAGPYETKEEAEAKLTSLPKEDNVG